jgi:hypothetical protein
VSEFELKPHIGKEKNRYGILVDVEIDQWQIMFRGIRVGYVGKKPNSPICLIRHYPASFHAEVRQFVASATNGEPSRITQPPRPEVLAKYQEELGGEEEGDE